MRLDAENGDVVAASAPVQLYSEAPGWAEADPSEWWANVCRLVPGVLPGDGPIAAVAATGMVPALIVADASGRPLRRAILQNDARAAVEIDAVRARLAGIDVLEVTGSIVTQQSIGPKVLWVREHEPEVIDEAEFICGSYDWVAHALGAAPHVEQNWALESGLFRVGGEPLAEALDAAGIAQRLLPPLVRSGTPLGAVSSEAAAATGLAEGTPIVSGGADHVLAAYAAGLTRPGQWLVKLGGAGDILAVSGTPSVDARLYLDHHPAPDLWLPNGCMATSGSLLRWLQRLFGNVPLDDLDRQAEAAAPAELICLPYFLGEKSPLHDPALRGAFFGLHLGHTAGDVYRSCLEAVAYGMRQHVEVFEELRIPLDEAFVTNGGSKSTVWKQILADVLNRPLTTVAQSEGASVGAAIVAGVGAGVVEDWYGPAELVARTGVIRPESRRVERYEEAYRLFREAQAAATPVSHALSARQRPGLD